MIYPVRHTPYYAEKAYRFLGAICDPNHLSFLASVPGLLRDYAWTKASFSTRASGVCMGLSGITLLTDEKDRAIAFFAVSLGGFIYSKIDPDWLIQDIRSGD